MRGKESAISRNVFMWIQQEIKIAFQIGKRGRRKEQA